MRRVTSLLFWIFMTLSSIALFPIAFMIWLLTVLFDRRLVVLHRFTCFWGSIYTWLNPSWAVTVKGREHIDPKQTYVMVCNHQSLLDILVLFRLFVHFKWVSKRENFRIPCIGWNMWLNQYIPLRRGSRKSILKMIRACLQTLAKGSSVMFFPEGTRSHTKEMRTFRLGAFEIAQRAGVSILPVALNGTGDALPKHGFVMQGRHNIQIRVLEPIPASRLVGRTEDLAQDVRATISKAVDAIRMEAQPASGPSSR